MMKMAPKPQSPGAAPFLLQHQTIDGKWLSINLKESVVFLGGRGGKVENFP